MRPNSVIPVSSCDDKPDHDFVQGVTLRAYAIEDGAIIRTVIPARTGNPAATFELRRSGRVVTVTLDGQAPGWRLLLVGETVESTADASLERVEHGALVTPELGSGSVSVTLSTAM